MFIHRFATLALVSLVSLTTLTACSKSADELVVYSARKDHLIRPILDLYSAQTGTQVQLVTDKAGALLQRLQAEASSTPADVLITVDAGNLWQAAQTGLLQTVDSEVLTRSIPAYLRDPDNRWFGLSVRARTIVYNLDKVDPATLSSYEALAEPKWKGRLCLRTSKKVYNQSLVAMLIEANGEAATEATVRGWVANFATDPLASDTQVLEAIAAGQCDVGIVNTYYLGRLQKTDPDLPLGLFWPNQTTQPGQMDGVHINVSGGAIPKHAPRPAAAQAFLEWLAKSDAQKLFAEVNLEYPAASQIAVAAAVKSWGVYSPSRLNLSVAGKRQAQAVKLMDRAGYR